ncbi:hypothetical protein QYM36_000058 [Artemia franciscana]|uniref:Uncharacterized protein n=1 Tax=Artemia franciscana TaxID=6661 RepID=A0AA88LBN6_ARTSF|nr:hypothetical protein QYM36_000058 [Artemia franciscana]
MTEYLVTVLVGAAGAALGTAIYMGSAKLYQKYKKSEMPVKVHTIMDKMKKKSTAQILLRKMIETRRDIKEKHLTKLTFIPRKELNKLIMSLEKASRSYDCFKVENSYVDMVLVELAGTVEQNHETSFFQEITKDFANVFTGIGELQGEGTIHLKPGTVATLHPVRRIPFALHDMLKSEIEQLEK